MESSIKFYFWVLVTGLFLITVIGVYTIKVDADVPRVTNVVGHYQLVTSGRSIMLLDTATGDVYVDSFEGGTEHWARSMLHFPE